MTKVVFMGLPLTRHWIGPTEVKVRVVVEASQPESPSEVRSFLGLVGVNSVPDSCLILLLPLTHFGRLRARENHLPDARSRKSPSRNSKSRMRAHLSWHTLTKKPTRCTSTREEWGTPWCLLCQSYLKQS